MAGKSIFDKLWDRHVITGEEGQPQLMYVDQHYIHEVSKKHPEIWTGTDQVHFGSDNTKIEAGSKLYSDTISEAVKAAKEKPVKTK